MGASLGLDFGQKRIGIAVSDEMGLVASPLETHSFQSREKLRQRLDEICEEYRVQRIVVGLPKTLKGELEQSAQKVTAHVDWLKEQITSQEWILWDERLTTKEVERVLLEADVSRAKRKDVRDQLAAQRILQSYLDWSQRS